MSGLQNRHSLASFFSSKAFSKRWQSRISAIVRSSKRRSLRVESLERREMMATDVAAIRHNMLVPTDVNGDFDISPVDALQVINALNRQSRGALSSNASMYDVNNDGALSPIDALMVINRLKTGEGVGEIAEVKFQVLNANGIEILPTPGAPGVPSYTVTPGQNFTIRTRARDLQQSPTGVFSAYVDINYATKDNPTSELAQVLWSEVQTLRFSPNTNGGTFTLTYGSETTAPITFSSNAATTRANIKAAVGALSVAGGASNITVNSLPGTATEGAIFDIFFVGSKARQNVTDATIGSNNLTVTGVGSNTVTVSAVADPTNKLSLSAAFNFPSNMITPTSFLTYNGGTSEATFETVGTTGLKINDAGNFSSLTTAPAFDDPSIFVNIFDTNFRASTTPGIVDFSLGSSQSTRLGVGIFGTDVILADTVVMYPGAFQIVIATDLSAANDTASVAKDSQVTNIVVGANDVFKAGTTFTITSVTQSVNGTVAIVGGSSAGATLSFTPTTGFAGQTTFTYTIANDQTPVATSTATVTVNVNAPNNPPVALGTALSATEAGPAVNFTPAQLYSPGNSEDSQTVTLSSPAIVSGQGTISLVAGNVTYTPSADDFFGPVTFTVTGTDNGNPIAATTATFTINVADVNDAPTAKAPTLTTPEDVNLTILALDLFSPGPGPEVGTQTVILASATAVAGQTGGTISVVGGNAQFVPTAQFSGTFAFVAVGRDSATPALDSTPATFTITVTPVNDAPTAVADTGAAGFIVMRTAGVASPLNVLLNDLSGDVGDTILVTAVTQPTSGTVAIGPNGANVTYTPLATTPVGSVQTFTYTITDGGGLTSTTSVDVSIDPPTRPFAVDDTVTTPEATPITINVLLNDFANTGATKRLQSLVGAISPATSGTVTILDNGTPADKSDDTIRYVPAAGFTSVATFVYRMDDSSVGSVATDATVTVTVGDFNDPPTVVNRTESTPEDTQLTIPSSRILEGSTKGGTGEESQILLVTATSVSTSGAGSAVVTNGNVVYTPTLNFNGQVLISFTVTDNGKTNGLDDFKTATGTITVNVTAVNDAPTAKVTSGLTIAEDSATPLTIPASNLFSAGPDNESSQTVSVKSVTPVPGQTGGTVSIVGGNAVFAPALNFNGSFSFIVIGQDNGSPIAESLPSTVTVNVTAVNDAPVPVVAVRAANATIPLIIDLTSELAQASRGGGADEASQTVRVNRVIPVTGVTKGIVSVNTDGTIRYTAPSGSSGVDVFDYEVIDNGTTNGIADPKVGIARITINIAAFQPSSVSGQVWIDDDRDGSKDSDELVLGGISVVLTGRAIGATSDITPVRLTTLGNGTYSFDGLAPGTYTVNFTPPIKMVDAPAANFETRTIVAPGGVNSVVNFSVFGLEAGYNSIIENAESEFYLRNGQHWRDVGLSALVKADGTSAWTINRGGFEGYRSESVRITSSGIILTVVTSSNEVLESTLARGTYISTRDAAGNTLIRIFATPAQLSFRSVAAGEGESSVANVDRVFAQMGR